MQNWLPFISLILFSGCSAVLSTVDKVELVHLYNGELAAASTPAGFVVTPEEVAQHVPLTKFGWNIYADSEYYYLSSAVQKFTSKTGDNSWLAKENGIRIKGTDRSDIEKLTLLREQSQGPLRPGDYQFLDALKDAAEK